MYLYGNEKKMENEASDKKKDIKRGVQDGIPISLVGEFCIWNNGSFGRAYTVAGDTYIGCKCNIGGTVCRC